MSLDDLVNLNISVSSATATKPSFGVGLLAGCQDITANILDEYAAPGEMTDAGYPTYHPLYKRALKYFGQNPHPTKIIIGRRANKHTKTIKFFPLNLTQGFHYLFTVVGTTGVETAIDYPVPASATKIIVARGIARMITDLYETCTAEADTDLFTRTAHGFLADQPVKFAGTVPAGITVGTTYYVIAAGLTADDFEVSATPGGSVLNITTDGSTFTVARDVTDVVGIASSHAASDEFFTLTVSVAGTLFEVKDLPRPQNMKVQDITTDPGIVADLSAMYEEDPLGWYDILLDSESEAEVEAASPFVETIRKQMMISSCDSDIAVSSVTTDIASDLKAATYLRTSGSYYSRSTMGGLEAAWGGIMLPEVPGSATWDYKTLAGITVDNLTGGQVSAAKNKRFAVYTALAGIPLTQESRAASGQWRDVVLFIDWLYAELQGNLIQALANNKKIAFTDDGIQIVYSVIDKTLARGVRVGGLAKGYTITVPKVATVSADDKINRVLRDVNFSATLAGAIHKLVITGTVSP